MKQMKQMKLSITFLLYAILVTKIIKCEEISYDPVVISQSDEFTINKDETTVSALSFQTPLTIHQLLYDNTTKTTKFKVKSLASSADNLSISLTSNSIKGQWIFTKQRYDGCSILKAVNTNYTSNGTNSTNVNIFVNALGFGYYDKINQKVVFKNISAPSSLLVKDPNTLSANSLCSSILLSQPSAGNKIYVLNTSNIFVENNFTGNIVTSDDFDYIYQSSSNKIKSLNKNTFKYEDFTTITKTYSSVNLFSSSIAVAFVGFNPIYNPDNTSQTLLTEVQVKIYRRANSTAIKSYIFSAYKTEIIYKFSSELSKLIIFYKDSSQNIVILGNSFDLAKSKSFDLTFKDRDHLKTGLLKGVNLFSLTVQKNGFLFTDNTLQQSYLFNGLNVFFFKSMNITTKYQGSYGEYYIDLKKMPSFGVFLISKPSSNGFTVIYFDYGKTNQNRPLRKNPILSLQIPRLVTEQFTAKDRLFWRYSYISTLPQSLTNFTMLTYDNKLVTKYYNYTNQVIQGLNVKDINSNCGAYQNKDKTKYLIFLFNITSGGENQIDISTIFNSTNYSNTSSLVLANNCNRFRINKDIYRLDTTTNNSYVPISNMASYRDWTASDQNFNYIVRNGREIWKYNLTINQYALFYTFDKTLLNTSLSSFQDRIVVTSFISSNQIEIFVINSPNSITPKLFFTKIISNLTSPSVKLSPNMSKIIVFGYDLNNSSNPKTTIFHIDYTKANGGLISIDKFISNFNIERDFEYIQDNFIYFRVFESNNTDNTESLYYFSTNRKTYRIFMKPIASIEGLQWISSFLQRGTSIQDITVLSVLKSDYHLNIYKVEANAKILEINQKNYDYSVAIIDGKVIKCTSGCSDCSSGSCVSCMDGYAFDSETNSCIACYNTNRCATCDSKTPTVCTDCFPGTVLRNDSCIPCDKMCFSCSVNATNCVLCRPGKYYIEGKCLSCSENCVMCTDASTCTRCARGSVLVGSICRKCAVQCSRCNPNNITECTDCVDGMHLVGSSCFSCPQNCKICEGTICMQCFSGYLLNTDGRCANRCNYLCATCLPSQPSKCTSCFNGTILQNNQCRVNISCNNNNSCTSCGDFSNLYLNELGQCVSCPSMTDCIQCQALPYTNRCSICSPGSYLNSQNFCSKCPPNCSKCLSNDICSQCNYQYTFIDGQAVGRCLFCEGYCANCYGQITSCLQCFNGYTKRGSICQYNDKISYKFVLNTNPTYFLNNIDNFTSDMLSALSRNDANLKKKIRVNIYSVTSGSTIVEGSITSNTNGPNQLQSYVNNIQNQLSDSKSIGGFKVSASSLEIDNQSNEINTQLVVGLSIGLFIAAVIILIIVLKIIKSKCQNSLQDEAKSENKPEVEMQHTEKNLVKMDGQDIIKL